MAELQWRSGALVKQPLVAVVGNKLPLKLIPSRGDKLPFTVSVDPASIAVAEEVDNRLKANFTTFTLSAVAGGKAHLVAKSGDKAVTGTILITVVSAVALPDAGKDAGLLARLFLAETPDPKRAGKNAGDIPEAMKLMRVVVENRLATPSGRWRSAGAKTLSDVVQAKDQFAGFQDYPKLEARIAANIAELVKIANDANDPPQPQMRAHVEGAIAIATGSKPQDPTSGKLYWWRTKDKGAPGTGISIYKTLAGNTFYKEGK